MKKNVMRILSLVMVVVIMATAFAGCGSKTEVNRPEAVSVKTDLKDVYFTFTYGELKNVLPGDKLATLFENTNKKLDSREVQLSYYELVSKFGGQEYFTELIKLISDEEMTAFVANQQEVLDYFNIAINDIKQNKREDAAYITYDEAFWINHGKDVVFKDVNGNELDGQDELKAAFRLYGDAALKNIGSYLMNDGGEAIEASSDLTDVIYPLGEKTASTLTLQDLYTETDAETGVVTQPVYSSVVPTFVYDLDEKGNNAKYTEGELEGEYIFVPSELYRTINIAVKPEEESVKKAFTIREKEGILEHFKVAEAYMTVNSFEIAFNPCKISAGFNAVSDQMTYVTYEKNMIITANVTFTGSLSKYGTVIVEFPCTSSLTYNFGWEVAEKAE